MYSYTLGLIHLYTYFLASHKTIVPLILPTIPHVRFLWQSSHLVLSCMPILLSITRSKNQLHSISHLICLLEGPFFFLNLCCIQFCHLTYCTSHDIHSAHNTRYSHALLLPSIHTSKQPCTPHHLGALVLFSVWLLTPSIKVTCFHLCNLFQPMSSFLDISLCSVY